MTETGKPIILQSEFLSVRGQEYSAYDAVHRADFEESDDFALSNSDRHLLHAAAVAQNGESASFVLPSAQQADGVNPSSEAGKRKREEYRQTQLTIAEQAQQLSKQLAAQIAVLEAGFETRFGDSWREEIANRVMGPDDIPHRKDGESMAEYRQRLGTVLIATMIDENGNVRSEYANSDDPDVRHYAEWAQAKHTQSRIENASDAELEQIVSQSSSLAVLKHAESSLSHNDRDASSVVTQTQAKFDDVADIGSDSAAFPSLSG